MKGKYAQLIALMLLVILMASCGRTVYSRRYVNKSKFTKYKQHNHYWHKHQTRPHSRSGGGYW